MNNHLNQYIYIYFEYVELFGVYLCVVLYYNTMTSYSVCKLLVIIIISTPERPPHTCLLVERRQ